MTLQVGDRVEYFAGDPHGMHAKSWVGHRGVITEIRWGYNPVAQVRFDIGPNFRAREQLASLINLKRIEEEVTFKPGDRVQYREELTPMRDKKLLGQFGTVSSEVTPLITDQGTWVWVKFDLLPDAREVNTKNITLVVPELSTQDRRVVAAFLRGDDWRGNGDNSMSGEEADRIAQILDPRSSLKREIAKALEEDKDLRCFAPNLTADVVAEVIREKILAFEPPSGEWTRRTDGDHARKAIADLLNYLEG